MKSINFNQNIKTYAINGDENNVVKLNTSDYGIFTRAEEMQTKFVELSKEATQAENESNFEKLKKVEKDVRNALDYIFNTDVCTPAFGKTNCLSPCNGSFIFMNFLEAMLEVLKEDMVQESKKFEANVSKYTKQLPQLAE